MSVPPLERRNSKIGTTRGVEPRASGRRRAAHARQTRMSVPPLERRNSKSETRQSGRREKLNLGLQAEGALRTPDRHECLSHRETDGRRIRFDGRGTMGFGAIAPQGKPRGRFEPSEKQATEGQLGKLFRMSEIGASPRGLTQQTSRNEGDKQTPRGVRGVKYLKRQKLRSERRVDDGRGR